MYYKDSLLAMIETNICNGYIYLIVVQIVH